MKRNILKSISIIMTFLLLTGCTVTVNDPSAKDQNISNANVENANNNETIDNNEGDNNTEANTDNNNVENTGTENAGNESEEDKTIYNNGGYYVGVGNKVFFRKYGSYGLASRGNPESFMYPFYSSGNEICYFETDTPDNITTVCTEDSGYGRIYYGNNGIYSQERIWDGEDINTVYKIDLSTGQKQTVCNGFLSGSSESGEELIIYDFVDDYMVYSILQNDKTVGSYSIDSMNYGISTLAVDSESFYFTENEYLSDDIQIIRYDYKTDTKIVLASINSADLSAEFDYAYPVTEYGKIENDTLTFKLYVCEGSGAFVDSEYDVSLSAACDGNASDKAVNQSTLSLIETNEKTDISLRSVQVPEEINSPVFEPTNDSGYSRQVCSVEEINGTYYLMVADCHEAACWDYAESTTYYPLSMNYMYADPTDKDCKTFFKQDCDPNTVMAVAWFVGDKGSVPSVLEYQLINITSVEEEPERDYTLYAAKVSNDLVYEHFADNDTDYEHTEKDGWQEYVDHYSDESYNCYIGETEFDENGYIIEPSDQYDCMYVHIGFDENGQINYIRNILFD